MNGKANSSGSSDWFRAGDLEVLSETRNGVKLVRLKGEVHRRNAQILDDGLTEAVKEGEHVVLDMRDLALMTSPGLALLIKHTERLRDPDKIILAGMQPKVLEVFRALGLDQFFKIADSVEEAVKFLLRVSSIREGTGPSELPS